MNRGGQSVTIVRGGQSAPFMSGAPRRRRSSAGGERLYAWVVVSLLGASTALALYDAYVLLSLTAGG
jgi:hypothetical protein